LTSNALHCCRGGTTRHHAGNFTTSNYFIEPYVKYIVADIFENDTDYIAMFIDNKILAKEMIV